MRLETLVVGDGYDIADAEPMSAGLFRTRDGGVLVLGPPQLRTWSGPILDTVENVDWHVDGTIVRAADGRAVLDVAVLDRAAFEAAATDASEPMTVIGSFTALAGPTSLGAFLVGGEVLDTNLFGGRRCPTEQTALALWRTARHRGGAFWTAVADWVGDWTERRIAAAVDGMPRHDLWGKGECHTRFLVDAALLLLAVGSPVAERAVAAVTALGVDYGGGRWIVHDTEELEAGVNHLVLNTHVQAVVALLAAGRPVEAELRALDAALALRPDLRGALRDPAVWAVSMVRARSARGDHQWQRLQERAAADRDRRPHLVSPGGFIARDVGLPPAPRYLTVNLGDLAALCLNHPAARAAGALRSGLRFALSAGFFDAQLRRQDVLMVLVPALLANAGRPREAAEWANRLVATGFAPTIGWPGYEDKPWAALAPGTR